MSYNSKYTGRQVEEILDAVNDKVDKVEGKQLTTEDFTTALKQKLEGLSNYDDTAISEAVNTLREDFDTLVSGDSTTAIKTFNEIIAFLSGIEDSESLDSIIASIEQQIASKQDTIADLETIRDGAAKGATALQEHQSLEGYAKTADFAKVATSGSYNDLSDKPTIPAAVTVDTALSTTSTNPVQNKVVATGINAKYTKPSTGIPKSDLAADVQTSLGKADTALQTEQYMGTVTGVKINGTTKNPSSGVVDLGTVITDISGKQDKLVSGTNIKTINGMSILGEGDIAVGADNSGKLEAVYVDPVISGSTATYTIPSGVLAFCFQHDDATSVVLNLDCSSFPAEEYHQFHIFVDDISSASLSIGWQGAADSAFYWPNGSPPTLKGDYTTLELSLIGEVYPEDDESHFFAYGVWNSLYEENFQPL